MKNKIFILFFCFCCSTLLAQKIISGKVVTINNVPLEGASVYINNSSIGTTTNAKGEFSLSINLGTYDVIVSYLGFKTLQYSLNSETFNSKLIFKLEEDSNLLDEVVIYNTKYDDKWKFNFLAFKQSFIGRTEMAENCEILNPKVLHFIFNDKTLKLTAIAREPLQINHKDLGYLISYDLVYFAQEKEAVSYLGYTRYKPLKGNKRKQKKWEKNRLETFNGSNIHFAKSLLKGNFKEEGFIVHQFKRVPNPERPSEIEIKKAKELIRLSRNTIDFSKKIDNPKTALDSALVISKKSRLPKFQDYLYKSNISLEDIITKKNGRTFLTFENSLSVVYTKEKEERRYVNSNFRTKNRNPGPQTSSILKINGNPYIDKIGVIINPLDVFYEGYWSYEKFANALPLDYVPAK